MAFSLTASALLAGAAAAAVALAPTAAADTPSDSDDRGSGSSSSVGAVKPNVGAVKPNVGAVKPGARQNPLTRDFNSAEIPQGWKNDAIWARPAPGTTDTTFGKGPKPPVLALD